MPKIYALDIETDTSPLTLQERAAGAGDQRGLDPRFSRITTIAIHGEDGSTVLEGSERGILVTLAKRLEQAEPGVIATWNGSVFDMPFIKDRAALNDLAATYEPLQLALDPTIPLKYSPLPGHAGGYRVAWGPHDHVDLAYVFRDYAKLQGLPWALKPFAQAVLDIEPVVVDRERMHELTAQERTEYVASDAYLTYELAKLLPMDEEFGAFPEAS